MKNRDWRKNPFLKEAKKSKMKDYLRMAKFLFWVGVLCLPFIPLLIIPWLKTDEVFYFVIMLFAFALDILMIASAPGQWGVYSMFFPLNSLKEYEVFFQSEEDLFQHGRIVDDKGTFEIKVEETESGVWTILGQTKDIKLDLYSYPYPKEYIAGFFVRNFNYAVYNAKNNNPFCYKKSKESFSTIYKKRRISWLKKINDVKLVFYSNNNVTEKYILKNKVTQLGFFAYQLMYQTIEYNAWRGRKYWTARHQDGSERTFRNYCNVSVFDIEGRPTYWYEPSFEYYSKSELFDENGRLLYPDNDARLSHPKYAEKNKK
ncbi:MAG: hypothetical protein IJV77_07350 [Clostridia bacterium]|nr:hypothetical protein [Clostridia bacterium]